MDWLENDSGKKEKWKRQIENDNVLWLIWAPVDLDNNTAVSAGWFVFANVEYFVPADLHQKLTTYCSTSHILCTADSGGWNIT